MKKIKVLLVLCAAATAVAALAFLNNVAAVVFDFRGYDTLGESFILLTAIAGSFVILAMSHHGEEDEKDEV